MLKLYTINSFLTEEHRRKVFPLLFDLHFLENEQLLNYYTLVENVQECDIVVVPIDYVQFLKYKAVFNQIVSAAKKNDKPIWIYTAGDYGFTNYMKNSYTFRLGGFNSKLYESTYILPSFISDPYETELEQGFSVLKKTEKPCIGFVGHAQPGFKKYVKEYLNHIKYKLKSASKLIFSDSQSFYPSSIKRAYFLNELQKSKMLKTDFVLRENYKADARSETLKKQTKKEFYNNTYTFCSRGVGNFSVRFYETLAVGRIPVLLNTDCRLPLEHIIDWSKHCIIIDEAKKESIEEQILEFHNSISDKEFETLQESNRILWETHLRRHAFFINMYNLFLKEKNNNV